VREIGNRGGGLGRAEVPKIWVPRSSIPPAEVDQWRPDPEVTEMSALRCEIWVPVDGLCQPRCRSLAPRTSRCSPDCPVALRSFCNWFVGLAVLRSAVTWLRTAAGRIDVWFGL
jgi:hypothetical protein